MRLAGLFLIILTLGACASLPDTIGPFPEEIAPPPAQHGILASIEDSITQAKGSGQSGFWLLDKNADALTWRLALLDSAVSSLDLMYYLWYGDNIGRLMLDRVFRAAERGVKVRLLVDDLLLIGSDEGLVAIDQHPNIQLRLFNPKRQRKAGMTADFLGRFEQMNSRMHDKLIVADNHAVILGGRNIGDYYFGMSSSYNFHDLDVLGFGPVARQSSELFDDFWNSNWVLPASELPAAIDKQEKVERRDRLVEELKTTDSLENFPIEPQDWNDELESLVPKLAFGTSEVIYDRLEDGELVQRMPDSLGKLFRSAEHDIQVINAYIIPDQGFIDGMKHLIDKGVRIRILTNSLGSHDVPAVNSHYKQWRKLILDAGAELFEFRADPAIKSLVDTPPVVSEFSGLHTKAFVVDGYRVFIGSMNFDPRSADINTEMGIIIDSPGLGKEMVRLADRDMAPENAWQVKLNDEGKVIWTNSDETVTKQPARSTSQRFMDSLFEILPKNQF